MRFVRENGLSLFFGAIFLAALVGQSIAGHRLFNEEQLAHDAHTISYGRYLVTSDFGQAVLENWQSEWLQFALFMFMTIWLVQKGSPESKELGEEGLESDQKQRVKGYAPADGPRWAKARGLRLRIYENSLLIFMVSIFLASWFVQSVTGWTEYNEEQRAHGGGTVSWTGYLDRADFWEKTLQNWQSEFLAVGLYAILTVYLRQRGSPESKPVGAPHSETGVSHGLTRFQARPCGDGPRGVMVDRYTPLPRHAWTVEQPALTVETCRRAFAETLPFTLGVEEELMLLAPDTLELRPAAENVLAALDGDLRFSPELRAAQIEILTPVCDDAAMAQRELTEARRVLIAAARGRAVPAAAGTHPFSTEWGGISSDDRYRLIADLYPWASSRVACGLHAHVAVGDADRALTVFNALRSFIPELSALGANSPFLEGRDTVHCSIRAALNDAFPRAGIPPAFRSWDEFVGLVDWGRASGSFPDATFIWWDLRPHPGYGTIEFRMPDAQTSVRDAAGVAAVAQCLTAWLCERDEAGEDLPVHDAFRIGENAWSALRFGLGGWLLDLETGEPEPTRERLARLLDDLEPVAARLGASEQLAHARTLIAGNGAERQRYVAERSDLEDLVHWLVAATDPDA